MFDISKGDPIFLLTQGVMQFATIFENLVKQQQKTNELLERILNELKNSPISMKDWIENTD